MLWETGTHKAAGGDQLDVKPLGLVPGIASLLPSLISALLCTRAMAVRREQRGNRVVPPPRGGEQEQSLGRRSQGLGMQTQAKMVQPLPATGSSSSSWLPAP